jgi:transcriptional regulator with XRE-family HTH domain
MTKEALSRSEKKKVGHFVHEWRKYRDLTQEELAERVGLTSGAISQLENGIIAYKQPTLEALAEALGCEPGDILSVNPLADPSRPRLSDLMAAAAGMPDTFLSRLIELILAAQKDEEPPPAPLPGYPRQSRAKAKST